MHFLTIRCDICGEVIESFMDQTIEQIANVAEFYACEKLRQADMANKGTIALRCPACFSKQMEEVSHA